MSETTTCPLAPPAPPPVTRLDTIAGNLSTEYTRLQELSRQIFTQGARVGELLAEAHAICNGLGVSFHRWIREHVGMPENKARIYQGLYAQEARVQSLFDRQQTLDFTDVRKLVSAQKDTPPPQEPARAHFPYQPLQDTIPQYEEDPPPPNIGPEADAVAQTIRWSIPPRMKTAEDFQVAFRRWIGLAYLLGAMPEDTSIRVASDVLNVSHDTLAKYIRSLEKKTGIRSPRGKSETARRTYSRVQSDDHWRKRPPGPDTVAHVR